ncbi:hypothetical protein TEA_020907 [Camellia sinensis var. sinensis]|uniref:Rx N-terminal domain-containing protein n=1 Tax=Camellia sinensis var. sinensis TaxID=542762 RepID=A0A4S4D4N0_CAMSN|nr:hypothetical protein TEA_020907 [Camellia sinensis var. sinensis]
MNSSISQPNLPNNHHHKATTATNNNDNYQVRDLDLTNMIGRDLNFMKENMAEIQKFADHMNVQIKQACEKFEEQTKGGSDTNELDQLKISSGNYQVDVNKAGNLHSFHNDPNTIGVALPGLPLELDDCLDVFSIFQAMATIKKRIMIYWWIGRHIEEEIMLRKMAEDFVNEILDELTAKGFIEPIYKNCGLLVHSYKMPSYICSALEIKRNWCTFDYFQHGCLTCWNRCIVNVDAAIIDGRHEIIFKRGTNLKVVYMACHNLEVVPNWIGLLKNLTHLDISECYLLDHMPKGLGALFKLQVLKGFIIGDSKDKKSCTINDLTKLPKLRILSISTSKIDDLPKQVQLFSKRTTLTRSFTEQHDPELPLLLELPSSLQKLELECFPEIDTPSWLRFANLKNLKKLYIRGGLLCKLDEIVATTVEMLQLKYLSDFQMHWVDLRRLFPKLIYLEKVECRDLNSFLCDQNGVWMRKYEIGNGIDEKCGGRSY